MGTSKAKSKDKHRRSRSNGRSRSPGASPAKRRSRSYSRRRSRSPEHLRFQLKALKHVTQGNVRRLRKLLRRSKGAADLAAVDSQRRTLLHQACSCGHADVVALLLRHGAPSAALDAAGDTPAHLAARSGHLETLAGALQAPDAPSLDSAGAGGVTLRELMARALRGGGDAAATGPMGREGAAVGGAPGAVEAEEVEEDDDARWRRRLREEDSDGEGEGGSEDGWGGVSMGAEARAGDSDDEWADRLWRDMQRRRAAAAAASTAAFAADLRAESARRAAEAEERSQRILREERSKDADWRHRTLAAIEAGPAAAPLDLTASRVAYDERWEQLDREAVPAGAAAAARAAPLSYWDVPWPLEPQPPAGPATRPGAAAPPAAPPPAPSADALRDFLLLGAAGPSDVKRRLRAELLRWHPDKFGARFSGRLAAAGSAHRAVAEARVQQLAQVLTQVLGRGGSG